MKDSLKQILLDEINKTEGWLTKGTLGLVAERAGYLPEGCGRHLRFMAGGATKRFPNHTPEILVSYYKGKRKQNLSRYARLGQTILLPIKPTIVVRDGRAYIL